MRPAMSTIPACPQCASENTYQDGELYICPDCAHEWSTSAPEEEVEAELFRQYGTDPEGLVSALQREAMVAMQVAKGYQEVKALQTQLMGPPQDDPLVKLKEQEIAQNAQNDQAKLQMDQQRIGLDQQKEQNDVQFDSARLALQQQVAAQKNSQDAIRNAQQGAKNANQSNKKA